jgi:hypothetical protein
MDVINFPVCKTSQNNHVFHFNSKTDNSFLRENSVICLLWISVLIMELGRFSHHEINLNRVFQDVRIPFSL